MKTTTSFPFALVALVLLGSPLSVAADGLSYFPATLDNTTLADGTPLKVVAQAPTAPEEVTRGQQRPEPNNHWHWQGDAAGVARERGVFTAAGATGNNAPMLRTLLTGLKPNAAYQVHGFFWIDGTFGENPAPKGEQCWDIRFGLGMASIKGYGFAVGIGLPDTIGVAKNSERVVRQMAAPLRSVAGEPAVDCDNNRCLFRAVLGVAKTDAKGTLMVYVDDQAHDTNQARTCYDGIDVSEAPAAAAEWGTGNPAKLTQAVRAGDWEMMRRELAAGADPNTIDTEGRTPLFYLCAVGDVDRAAALLKAGAKPDVPGQRMSRCGPPPPSGTPSSPSCCWMRERM